jgi:hypothetical protein
MPETKTFMQDNSLVMIFSIERQIDILKNLTNYLGEHLPLQE